MGQVFKTKNDVKTFMILHVVSSRRALYFEKNEKIRIQVKCDGVVGEPGQNGGRPSTSSKVERKGKSVIDKKN